MRIVWVFAALACSEPQPSYAPPLAGRDAAPVVLDDYPWIEGKTPPLVRLDEAFSPPTGFVRTPAAHGSWARWLRGLPLRRDRVVVHAFDGSSVSSPAAAIAYLDVGKRDLQQCADSIIRLHAEFLWHADRQHLLAYHFTSGDVSRWDAWLAGERFSIRGSAVERRRGSSREATHAELLRYLRHLFIYAGTMSLGYDSSPSEDVRGGDFLVLPGSPGHAVLVLDVVSNRKGERRALLGQGFMPAQEFHVIRRGDQVWFDLESPLEVPSWPRPFTPSKARRFKHP